MSDRDSVARVLRRGLANLAGERPEPAEIREMLDGTPQETASRRWMGLLAVAAVVVAMATLVATRFLPEPGRAAAFESVDLPLIRIDPGEGFAKEKYRATLLIREEDAELRLDYEPADGGARTRVRTKWEPLPLPAGAKEDDLPALRIVADGAAPWHRVHRLAAPGMGSRTSFYFTGRGEDGRVRALPLLVKPPAEARRLGPAVTPADIGLAKHRGAFRALWVERGRRKVQIGIGPVGGDVGFEPERSLPVEIVSTSASRGDPKMAGARVLKSLAKEVEGIERMPTSEGARSVIMVLVSHDAYVVDVLRAVELAGGDPEVLFWVRAYDRGVMSDGRGLAADILGAFELRERDVAVQVPVAGALPVDVFRRKRLVVSPNEIPFPEERFERLVLEPRAATPWRRCLPAVLEARRRKAGLEFKFMHGRVLSVPELRGGQKPVEVRIGYSEVGKLMMTPGEKELVGKDIRISAWAGATAEDVFRTVQFLVWRGVVGVDFR